MSNLQLVLREEEPITEPSANGKKVAYRAITVLLAVGALIWLLRLVVYILGGHWVFID